jgi:pimeloyl-ACP methyl ester carboxylesterase
MAALSTLEIRRHGETGPPVVVLHGGPGAQGSAWGLASGLARRFRVLEPLQRRSGLAPLSVARHVEDLRALIEAELPGERPAVVGHSWGAMLALAFGASHPGHASRLALVGCGTFDPGARAALEAELARRMTPRVRAALAEPKGDADEALAALGVLIEPLYTVEPLPPDPREPPLRCDARGHQEAWSDMEQAQALGLYPGAFAAIPYPVLMLHGAADPHPGPRIRDSLLPHLPQLEYRELANCGHYPWRERGAREAFFSSLCGWLG